MVVEDEAILALHEAAVARDVTGAEVVTVHTLEDAMEQASGGEVDLAILDVALPDGEIFALADVLREHATPYVFVTAYGLSQIPVMHRSAPFLKKPFEESALRAALATLVVPRAGTRRALSAVRQAAGMGVHPKGMG